MPREKSKRERKENTLCAAAQWRRCARLIPQGVSAEGAWRSRRMGSKAILRSRSRAQLPRSSTLPRIHDGRMTNAVLVHCRDWGETDECSLQCLEVSKGTWRSTRSHSWPGMNRAERLVTYRQCVDIIHGRASSRAGHETTAPLTTMLRSLDPLSSAWRITPGGPQGHMVEGLDAWEPDCLGSARMMCIPYRRSEAYT